MLIYLRKKAQSTAEYVVLFAIVAGAIAMARNYLMKSVAGVIQTKADDLLAVTYSQQYEEGKEHSTGKSARMSDSNQTGSQTLEKKWKFNTDTNVQSVRAGVSGDLATEVDPIYNEFKLVDATNMRTNKVNSVVEKPKAQAPVNDYQ